MTSTSTEAVKFTNIGATTAAFLLRGGKYAIAASATGTGTMGLQMLGPDGSTFIPAFAAFATVTGYIVVDLPPGQYQFFIATFTAVSAMICRIPA
jgi:hypothetical protein